MDNKNTVSGAAETQVDAELAALEASARKVDSLNSIGIEVSFVSLASEKCQAMDEDNTSMYIEGLKKGDLYCQSKKVNFGKNLKVIPLVFIPVYNHYSDMSQSPKFIGTVSKSDGDRLPLLDIEFAGGKKNFSIRECSDGSVLKPAFWVPILLPDFPDIKDAVVTFKSTGNALCKAWKKDVKARGGLTASHMYTLGYETQKSADGKNKWILISPVYDHDLVTTDPDNQYPDGKELYVEALKMSVAIGDKEEANQLFLPFADADMTRIKENRPRLSDATADADTSTAELEDDTTF